MWVDAISDVILKERKMKWKKVKNEKPPFYVWVLACLADTSLADDKRLVRAKLCVYSWLSSNSRRHEFDEVSHWAPIELPEDEGIAKLDIGDRVKRFDDVYVVAAIGYDRVALINIEDGTRWNDGIHVDNMNNIAKSEIDALLTVSCGFGKFEKV